MVILQSNNHVTFNKFNDDDIEQELGPLDKNFIISLLIRSLKYNFGQLFLPRRNRLELTANAGVGFYHVKESNMTFNVGGGALWWLTDDKNFGLRAQTLAKFGSKDDVNNTLLTTDISNGTYKQSLF